MKARDKALSNIFNRLDDDKPIKWVDSIQKWVTLAGFFGTHREAEDSLKEFGYN